MSEDFGPHRKVFANCMDYYRGPASKLYQKGIEKGVVNTRRCQEMPCCLKVGVLRKGVRERSKPGAQSVIDSYSVSILGHVKTINLLAVCQ